MVSETKLDASFPEGQVFLKISIQYLDLEELCCSSARYPVKLQSHEFPSTKSILVEIKLYKKKWLINCSCVISRSLDTHSTKYDSTVILDDFNARVDMRLYRVSAKHTHLIVS